MRMDSACEPPVRLTAVAADSRQLAARVQDLHICSCPSASLGSFWAYTWQAGHRMEMRVRLEVGGCC